MMKKIIFMIFILFSLLNCTSSINEINERAKGDGVPYVPGI